MSVPADPHIGAPTGGDRDALGDHIAHIRNADTDHAIEIAERVWWVGHVLADDSFQCHSYLIEQGDQSVLIDPGSPLTFAGTRRKVEEVIAFDQIRWLICHHQDPDIAAALPEIDRLIQRNDAAIITHWRTWALLKHYGLKLPFWLVDEHDWRLPLLDRELRFIFTPYAHFPGAICSFDSRTGVLFSSDIFGAFCDSPQLVAADEGHIEAMRPFHEHYMPSSDILDYALTQIERHPLSLIAPQHGAIIPPRLVRFFIEQLKHLDCGLYLLGKQDSDIRRLSRLNATLREMTETMLLYRDFRDIATRLLELVQRTLPATRMDYYAVLPNGDMLSLTQYSRYIGTVEAQPDPVCRFIGGNRSAWITAHHHEEALLEHRIHDGILCDRSSADGERLLTLPLSGSDGNSIDAIVVIALNTEISITAPVLELVTQISKPLYVAIEREVIYRSLDLERERAYQRSIRDSLTGLYTRVYMQDIMARSCALHDRDPGAAIAAIMIDLDHFKRINDGHGHLAGDQVLRRVGALLRDRCRDGDVPVRFGGEEMILFLVGTDATQTSAVAERLRALIQATPIMADDGSTLRITASLGVAARSQGEALDNLIRRADEALYVAKQQGRNRVALADETGRDQRAG